ncbi:hypothetical protein VSX64_17650 [Aurantimonas sp. C2-6-R+9]|nr:hypothetical protein [Aurantimonas sp. C2-6-R+9]
MDDHHIERRGLAGARLNHPLELRAAVIGRRCAHFHEGIDKLIAPRGTVGFALLALIGDGDIMLGLPRRRDTQVKGGAQRNGHGRHLLVKSSARSEQVVEKVAEPRLEQIDFGDCDRNMLRPVVGDGPCREIVFDRTPDAGFRHVGVVMEVGRQRAASGTPATVLAARGARSGHANRIARARGKLNDPNLRHATRSTVARKDRTEAALSARR